METKEAFVLGGHHFEVRMWTAVADAERWYEIWVDGNILGVRNPWPIDPNTRKLLTEQELYDSQKRMLTEQRRRKDEAGTP
jgi:hypothetical protein